MMILGINYCKHSCYLGNIFHGKLLAEPQGAKCGCNISAKLKKRWDVN